MEQSVETSGYEWFAAWVRQNLSLSLTLARGMSASDILLAFGGGVGSSRSRTLQEADDEMGAPLVRAGEVNGWAFAVEHFTTIGADPRTLDALSRGGGLAISVTYTQSANALMISSDGSLADGFDMVNPQFRYGDRQDLFEAQLESAGLLSRESSQPEAGARFVELATGVGITRQMLEGLLPSVLPAF